MPFKAYFQQTPTPEQMTATAAARVRPALTPEQIAADLKSRQGVFGLRRADGKVGPEVVIIALHGVRLRDLPEVTVDRKARDAKLAEQTEMLGKQGHALQTRHAERSHVGHLCVEKATRTSLADIATQLAATGLGFKEAVVETWTQDGVPKCKTLVVFELGFSGRMSPVVSGWLVNKHFTVDVWANPNLRDESKGLTGGQKRVDTLNLRYGSDDRKPKGKLVVHGATWRVEPLST